MRRCGPLLDHDTLTQTLKHVSEPLATMLEPGRPADQSTLWVLRCAAELAATWPHADRKASNAGDFDRIKDPQGRWQVQSSHSCTFMSSIFRS